MEKTLYDLNLSQKVAKLQSTYTLFKRVINIIASATTNKSINLPLMQKAFNIVAERNDCLRIRFVKKHRKLKQYFLDKVEFNNIPYIEFKTKQEQEKFIKKLSSHVIKYKKGVVCEPYFCKTYDNKFMVLLKVAHLVLDIYGINYIFNDLFAVYDSLKNNTPLPAAPNKFEDVLKKELEQKNTEQTKQKNKQFFQEYLNQREEPSYAGIHGDNCKLWQKRKAKNKKTMKMFMLKNDTQSLIHSFDNNLVEKAVQYCKQTNCSMANLFFYTCSICTSKLNNNTKHMLPMELVNYRSSALEKNCAGTKAKSLSCYTTVDQQNSFEKSLLDFSEEHMKLYRHIHFADQDFQMLLHHTYKSSMLDTYFSISYSFLPLQNTDIDVMVYSNGKCMLPAYIALMWDTNKNTITAVYDCQTKIIKPNDVENFHNTYIKILEQVVSTPQMLIKDIKI